MPQANPAESQHLLNGGIGRLAINCFLILHLALMASWSIPFPIRGLAAVKNHLAPYAWSSGLFQTWDMFAPDPPH